MNKFQVGQKGTHSDGQRVTIKEVMGDYLVVISTTGARFTMFAAEFVPEGRSSRARDKLVKSWPKDRRFAVDDKGAVSITAIKKGETS